MKTASSQLLALLASRTFIMACLYEITLINGTTLYYTDHEMDLNYLSHNYISNDVMISRGAINVTRGVEVGTLELNISAQLNHLINSQPWIQAVNSGVLDNARIIVRRVFMPPTTALNPLPNDTSAGAVMLFSGIASDVSAERNSVRINVVSDLQLLNLQMPRNIYQPSCINTLYDTACGVNKATFTTAGTITAVTNRTTFTCSVTGQPAAYYNGGVIQFTSGLNAGIKRTITSQTGGALTIHVPTRALPQVGDTMVIYPGCDKLKATCSTKFSNLINHRGMPYIPTPETAM